jgi:Fe-S-cluster containining protein
LSSIASDKLHSLVMSRYRELAAKVDAFFARVEARHGEDMQCGSGCADCCHTRLTITEVEAAAIRELVAGWPADRRAALAARAANVSDDRCSALEDNGRCAIYAARPIVCRSHGAPIRMREDSLPVIRNCFRNFTRATPDADCIIDQETLSTLVLAVDREAGRRGQRIDLAAVLAAC